MKVTVTNTGDGPARGGKLRLGRERGLRTTPQIRSLGTISAGRSKTVRVRVRLVGGARATTDLSISAIAGKLKVRDTVTLLRAGTSSGGGSGSGGSGGGSMLCNRYSPDPFGDTGGSLILVPC